MNIWSILGIKATGDIAAIKKAYAKRAAECHPEEDPRGFQVLHEAYLDALEMAKGHDGGESGNEEEKPHPSPPVFRRVPENLRKLGSVGPVDGEDAERETLPENGEPGQPATTSEGAAYRFPRATGGRTKASRKKKPSGDTPPPKSPPKTPPALPPELPKDAPENVEGYHFPQGNAADAPPAEDAENAPGYVFPQPGKPQAEAMPSGDTPEHGGAYRFPKDGDDTAPQEEDAHSAPGYVFPQPDKPQAEATPSGDTPEHGGAYRFPRGSSAPASPPQHGQTGPGRSVNAPSGGIPLIFPGFPFLDGGAADLPFMPLVSGSSPALFPQTKEEEERLRLLENARTQCLNDMQILLEQNAPEQDWYPLLRGVDFTLIQYDRKFLLGLLELCRKQLPLEMASALYMAYGFASDKSLRKYPAATTLYTVLNQFLQLPQGAMPSFSLSENLHRSDMALAGIARLSAVCGDPYIWGQALQTPAFVQARHQPYFLLKLADFLRQNDSMGVWRQALAAACQFREPPVSPCLLALAEQLPPVTEAPVKHEYTPAADDLLVDEAALDAFLGIIRKNILDMLKKTRKGFPQSTRRGPWDYVFARPEFALVRRDWAFLTELLSFLHENSLPKGIWPALGDAYAVEFADLPQQESAAPEFDQDTPPEERATACLLLLREKLDTHGDVTPNNPTFLEIVKSMLRSI